MRPGEWPESAHFEPPSDRASVRIVQTPAVADTRPVRSPGIVDRGVTEQIWVVWVEQVSV